MTTPTPSSTRDNLIKARALIDTPEKWGRGAYVDTRTNCRCVVGSLVEVMNCSAGYVEGDSEEGKALAQALPPGWERDTRSVIDFNDDPSITHADIMALFDRAISSQENQS